MFETLFESGAAALRPDPRQPARLPVRRRHGRDRLGRAGAARAARKRGFGAARDRQPRRGTLPSDDEHRVPRAHRRPGQRGRSGRPEAERWRSVDAMDDPALAWLPAFPGASLGRTAPVAAHRYELSRATCSGSSLSATSNAVTRLAARRQPARAHVRRRRVSARRIAAHDSAPAERVAQLLQLPAARSVRSKRNPAVDVQAPKAQQAPARDDRRRSDGAPARASAPTTQLERARQGDHGVVLFLRPAPVGARRPRTWSTSICADRTVRVLGKGSKTRVVPVGRYAVDALARWLQGARRRSRRRASTALFVGKRGEPHRPARRAEAHRRLGAAAGPGPSTCTRTCSAIRSRPICSNRARTCAVCRNCSATRISSTTQIYTHLDFQHLAKIYDAAHPRARRRRPDEPHDRYCTALRSSPSAATASSPSAATARCRSATP